jgi:putative heme iron utilization protein
MATTPTAVHPTREEPAMSHGGRHDPVQHVNDDHADDLLAAARAFGGHPDALSARAERIDRDGMDLSVDTPRGAANARVTFNEPVPDGDSRALRAAFAELARRARTVLAGDGNESDAT